MCCMQLPPSENDNAVTVNGPVKPQTHKGNKRGKSKSKKGNVNHKLDWDKTQHIINNLLEIIRNLKAKSLWV